MTGRIPEMTRQRADGHAGELCHSRAVPGFGGADGKFVQQTVQFQRDLLVFSAVFRPPQPGEPDDQKKKERGERGGVIRFPLVLLLLHGVQKMQNGRQLFGGEMKTVPGDPPGFQKIQTAQQRRAARQKQRIAAFMKIKQQIAERQIPEVLIAVACLLPDQKDIPCGNASPFAVNQVLAGSPVDNHEFRKFVAVQSIRLLRIPADQFQRNGLVRQKVGTGKNGHEDFLFLALLYYKMAFLSRFFGLKMLNFF